MLARPIPAPWKSKELSFSGVVDVPGRQKQTTLLRVSSSKAAKGPEPPAAFSSFPSPRIPAHLAVPFHSFFSSFHPLQWVKESLAIFHHEKRPRKVHPVIWGAPPQTHTGQWPTVSHSRTVAVRLLDKGQLAPKGIFILRPCKTLRNNSSKWPCQLLSHCLWTLQCWDRDPVPPWSAAANRGC